MLIGGFWMFECVFDFLSSRFDCYLYTTCGGVRLIVVRVVEVGGGGVIVEFVGGGWRVCSHFGCDGFVGFVGCVGDPLFFDELVLCVERAVAERAAWAGVR